MKFIEEFKKFAIKGNVVDMAIGVMIGTAFNKIVNSLVDDIVMPVLGVIIGGMKFSDYKIILREAIREGDKMIIPEINLHYGNFFQTLFNFFIIALSMFVAVKIVNKLREMQEKKAKEKTFSQPPSLSKEAQLLSEIKDLLVKKIE